MPKVADYVLERLTEYDAKLDHQPVVAIVGQQKRFSLGTGFQQEIDPTLLFSDVSEFVQTYTHPGRRDARPIDRGVRDRPADACAAPPQVVDRDR